MNATGFRVLVAEDEQTFGLTVTRFLQKAGHEVKICTTGKTALKALDSAEWDVLLLDLKLPDADGVDILARVRKEHPELQTIIVTGFANVQSAIDTMRLGAFDYLTKPPNFEELGMRVEKAGEKTLLERENRRLRFQVQRNLSSDILTRSPVLQKVLRTIEMVAAARTPVLIEGESGVGKELVAQHAHRLSPRANKGFVDLNCAAVPSSLLESELFGYERGAFTGAANEKPGLVEVADGGTLFLDEVGEMIPEIQSKFLRVLDSGTFYRVGATRKRRADFRLVCATNRDLKGEVAAGRFRKDLFFRVNGVKVVIPPLRERPEDIPLARRALREAAAQPEALHPGGARGALGVRLAGQRARAALRGGAGGPPGRGRDDRRRGPSAGDRREDGAGAGLDRRPRSVDRAARRLRRVGRPGRLRGRPRPRAGAGGARAGQVATREGGRDPGRVAAHALPLDQAARALAELPGTAEPRQLALAQDREADGGLEELVGEQPRPDAQVDARDASREPAREIHPSSLHEEVHDGEVVALPLGRGHRRPGRAHEAHPVAAAADEARERLAAPGVRLDEEDRARRSHASGDSNPRTTSRTLERKDLRTDAPAAGHRSDRGRRPVVCRACEGPGAPGPAEGAYSGACSRTRTLRVLPSRQTVSVTVSPGR